MDHELFDRLAVSLASRETPGMLTRRAAGAAAALALTLGIGGLVVEDAEAKSCRNKCKKKNTRKKRRRCRKKCKNKNTCTSNADCGNCETCTNGACVADCPADRCVTDPSGDVCCPEDFIACGLACCGDTTPICASPGTCTSACTSDTECGDCGSCVSGSCVVECPAERCVTDPSGDVCCPEDFIACGLACCGGATPVCVSPGTCGPAANTCPGGTCTGGPGDQGTCESDACNCSGATGTCVTCSANGAACTVDDECCGAAVCCAGTGNTCTTAGCI